MADDGPYYLSVPFDFPYYEGPSSFTPAGAGPYYLFTPFNYPYLDAAAVAHPMVPPAAPFSVSIGGHNYLIDTSFEPYRREAFRHRSIQAQKSNITVDNVPGEGTVDSQGLWRRIAQDWSLGSGQLYFDRRDSVDNRFRQSKGVDVWTQWQASLLPDVDNVYASENDVVIPSMVGNTLYVLDGVDVKFSTDLVTWTAMTGLPSDISDIATNGTDVWLASPSKGLLHSTVGVATVTLIGTPPMTYVAWCGDRLMSSQGPAVYNILADPTPSIGTLTTALTSGSSVTVLEVSGGTTADVNIGDQIVVISGDNIQTFVATEEVDTGGTSITVASLNANFSYPIGSTIGDITPLWTAPNTNWVWPSFAYGSSQIYLGGYVNTDPPSGGAVYRTTVDTDGIDLTVPVLALPLEGGEYPTALGSYLNLIFVGTNLGIRMCQTLAAYDPTGNQGDLRSGPLEPDIIQPVTQPITGIVGNGRFVYWTWNDFDNVSTGLGRSDLSHFIDQLSPAYASDLMVTGQGNVELDWCTITNSPVLGVPGLGLYVAAETFVDVGTIDSGLITYGIPDDKIAMMLSYRTDGSGGVEGQVSVETSDYGTYGVTIPGEAVTQWPLPQLRGEYFEIRTTLFPDANAQSPTLARWLLSSIAAVTAGIEISVVLMLFRTVQERGLNSPVNVYDEYLYLEILRESQTPVYYVEGPFSVLVTVDSLDWIPHAEEDASVDRGYRADIVVYLKSYNSPSVDHLPTFVTTT